MELRYALRSLLRTPWYSLTVAAVIGLSVLLATTVFAIVDGVLFKGLPYPDAEQLHLVSGPSGLSARDVREWSNALPDVPMAGYQSAFQIGATSDESPRKLLGARVGPAFFDVLGQRPTIGGFRPEHFTYTTARIPTLISYRLWRQNYAGAPNVVGEPLDLVGAVDRSRSPLPGFEIVGVLPPDFAYPTMGGIPDLVIPVAPRPDQAADRNEGVMGVLARLPPGRSPESIRDLLTSVAAGQNFRTNSDSGNPPRAHLIEVSNIPTLMGFVTGRGFRDAFIVAMVLVGLACVNVAALGLARARQRTREIAVRVALGASRWRIVRLGLVEVAPLAGVGTLAGLAAAPSMLRLVLSLMNPTAQLLATPRVDIRVAGFAAVTAMAVAIVSVLMQGRQIRTGLVSKFIRPGSGVTSPRGKWQVALLSLQVALASILVVAGTLIVGSLWWATHQDAGFDTSRGAFVEISAGTGTPEQRAARTQDAIARVRAIPGIKLGVLAGEFLGRSWSSAAIVRPDGAKPGREQGLSVGSEFFSVLGMKALNGRLFTPDEMNSQAPVVIVSQRVAAELWPEKNPIGQVLVSRGASRSTRTVIGVVPDARFNGIDLESFGQIYSPIGDVGTKLIATSSASADVTLSAMVQAVRSVGVPVGVTRAATLDAALTEPMRDRKFSAWLYGGFAGAALLIASAGILGLVAMTTALRTKEVGLRCALGASRIAVVLMILREQALPVFSGLLLGGIAAAWSVRGLKSSMYAFGVYDARLWALGAVAILAASAIGAVIPALRASRVNPVSALRAE